MDKVVFGRELLDFYSTNDTSDQGTVFIQGGGGGGGGGTVVQ